VYRIERGSVSPIEGATDTSADQATNLYESAPAPALRRVAE
jgi:hypothetical protein